jgi:hypothetical protein
MAGRAVWLPEPPPRNFVEVGIFVFGKLDSNSPKNAPNSGSVWIISPSN